MTKKRLKLLKEGETARMFRKREGRGGNELYCLVSKIDGHFSYRIIEKNGRWKDFSGFPKDSELEECEVLNFFNVPIQKQITDYLKRDDEEEEEERDKDFLRPFG